VDRGRIDVAPARIFAEAGAAPLTRRERRPLNQSAHATRGDGSMITLTVVDLANEGCGVLCPVSLLVGERLELSACGPAKIAAVVRWTDGARAGLAFDFAASPGLDHRARQHERISVEGEVSMRRAAKLAFRVRVYDLSPEGCKAEFVERPDIGEQLWIKFDGMEALEAKVRWIVGAKAGLRFVRPLHAAVFDLLVAKLRNAI
jgi:hypothetical protein